MLAGVLPEQKEREVARLQARRQSRRDGRRRNQRRAGAGTRRCRASPSARAPMSPSKPPGIILMRGDLRACRMRLLLARRTLRVIRQNLFWAFGYNAIGIPLGGCFGMMLSPMIASAAMALSSVSVVTNSLRLRSRS